ncbi:MAG TPA: hypothetical protein VD761_07735 [Solirubrobacterales bacterium]|nr:hypothetical protein [Solirubrobacterales bacterium]
MSGTTTKPEPHFPPPTFDGLPDKGKVKWTRPDPETGEVVIRGAVPVGEFRDEAQIPDPPAFPTKPNPPTGSIGWIAVQWPAYEQRKEDFKAAKERYKVEAKEYWDHFAEKLTRRERRDLSRGRIVAVVRPFEPAWEKGDRLPITDKITAIVEAVKEIDDGYRTTVVIEDFRSFYLKPIVSGSSKPKSDEHGFGVPVDPTTEEQARLDGAYTQSEDTFDAGDVLEDKLHSRLHREAAMKNAMAQSKGRVRASRFRLEERLNEARKKHQRSTVKVLERKLKAAEKHAQKAEQ